MDQSLDDIIKKNRGQRLGRGRGRGGPRGKGGQTTSTRGRGVSKPVVGRTGVNTKRGGLVDARLKIIEKKRQHIVDARDQLALLAKQTDAREKLNQLRVIRKPAAFSKGAGFKQLSKNDLRQGVKNQRGTFPSSKNSSRGGRDIGYGKSGYSLKKSRNSFDRQDVDIQYEEEEDYMDLLSQHLRTLPQRTVQNSAQNLLLRDTARGSRGIPPLLRVKVNNPLRAADLGESYYDEEVEYDDYEAMDVDPPSRTPSPPPVRQPLRQPVRQPARPPAPVLRMPEKTHGPQLPPRQSRPLYTSTSSYPVLRQDWESVHKTSILPKTIPSAYESGGMRSKPIHGSMLPMGRTGFAQPPNPVGFKVVVSNLQNSVTEEDIKELFGDIGPLISWRLIHPGTAEVVYKQRTHAVNAVEVYHKRQLDGQPMCVMIVSGDSRLPPTSKPGGSKGNVQPDLGIIHKALFKMQT